MADGPTNNEIADAAAETYRVDRCDDGSLMIASTGDVVCVSDPSRAPMLPDRLRFDIMVGALNHFENTGSAPRDVAAKIAGLEKQVYVPGLWRCAKCKFTLTQANFYVGSGTVGPRDEPGDKCPNCSGPLWRVTERQAGNDMVDRLTAEIEHSSTLRRELAARAIRTMGPRSPYWNCTLCGAAKQTPLCFEHKPECLLATAPKPAALVPESQHKAFHSIEVQHAQLLAALIELLPPGWGEGNVDHIPGAKAAREAIVNAGGTPRPKDQDGEE